MWLYLGVISALFLGIYDVSRKHALRENAVMPVLFFSTLCAIPIVVPVVTLSRLAPELMLKANLFIPPASVTAHLHLLNKAAIVSIAWVLSYYAMKNLPISIIGPVGVTGPVWTLIGALFFFHEYLTVLQYLGFAVMVVSYYGLSVVGEKEGIIFYNNKWILFALLSTLLGAVSALYDKYLISSLGYPPLVVQAWFLIYLVPVLGLAAWLFRLVGRKDNTPFVWRWSIPAIAVTLVLADVLYFRALAYSGSLISMLSIIRASCVLVSFFVGGILFCELRLRSKAIALAGIIIGICLILHST
jgi:bacterial/archaeal transporter family protein